MSRPPRWYLISTSTRAALARNAFAGHAVSGQVASKSDRDRQTAHLIGAVRTLRDWIRLERSGDLDNPGRESVEALCSLIRRFDYGRPERTLLRFMLWAGLFGSCMTVAMITTKTWFPYLAGAFPVPTLILASYA